MKYLQQSSELLNQSLNPRDKCALLELQSDLVIYQGIGKADSDAASIRATLPIPPIAIYYYEITVVNRGRDGYIGIGFCNKQVSTARLPGWEMGSWGYHGDDGHSFACSGTGKPYGPTFSTGDVIGCCCNFISNQVFFTKNGQNLGIAFKDLFKDQILYPCIGLRTPGETVKVNFGSSPFIFNIDEYCQSQQLDLWNHINDNVVEGDVNQLIYGYLLHHGYTKSAEMFLKGSNTVKTSSPSVVERAEIRDLIMQGFIDEAIEKINHYFPTLLQNHPHIKFQLSCRKFVEIIKALSLSNKPISQECLELGKILRIEFEELQGDKSNLKMYMDDLFSLVAYENPWNCPVGWILKDEGRENVATSVNSTILCANENVADLGQKPNPALENIWKQVQLIEKELKNQGIPSSFLIDVQQL